MILKLLSVPEPCEDLGEVGGRLLTPASELDRVSRTQMSPEVTGADADVEDGNDLHHVRFAKNWNERQNWFHIRKMGLLHLVGGSTGLAFSIWIRKKKN